MNEPIKLVVNPVDDGLVALLESLVVDAKKGDIVEVVITTRNPGGFVSSCYGGKHNGVYTMTGAIESSKLEYMNRYTNAGRTEIDYGGA